MGNLVRFLLVLLAVIRIHGSEVDNQDFASRSTNFTLDFYRNAFNLSENTVMSPVSIQSTLALLYHVANGKTASEMQRVLGLPATAEELIPSLGKFLDRTNSGVLKMVSKVIHSKEELNPLFLPVLQKSLKVEVESMDFTQKQQVADSANRWVDRATNGMIKDLMEPNDLKDDEHVILLNAITLDALWKLRFETIPEKNTFHFVNGDHEIDMMHENARYPYAKVGELKVLEIPYQNHTDLSMMLFMPSEESLEDFVERFDMNFYEELNVALRMRKGYVRIPKFTISSKIPVKDVLKSMGMDSIFDPNAFDVFASKVAELSELKQRAVINVYERGTTAAAVTEVRLRLSSSDSYDFIANRPFVYLIKKRSTKDILFIGHFSHYE